MITTIPSRSYPYGCPIPMDELRLLRIPYLGFDGKRHLGEMIANVKIADFLIRIFHELFNLSYPIEKIRLIDEYFGEDEASMSDNNTSCFNYRRIDGGDRLSLHAYGLAVDVNPLYNPYVRQTSDGLRVSPADAFIHTNRTGSCPYYIRPNDGCHRAFQQYGFFWGGDWEDRKDYQHFERPILGGADSTSGIP